MSKRIITLLAMVVIAGSPVFGVVTDYYWTDAGVGNDWDTPGNWSDIGGTPMLDYPNHTTDDSAIFDLAHAGANPTVNVSAVSTRNLHELRLDTGGLVTMTGGSLYGFANAGGINVLGTTSANISGNGFNVKSGGVLNMDSSGSFYNNYMDGTGTGSKLTQTQWSIDNGGTLGSAGWAVITKTGGTIGPLVFSSNPEPWYMKNDTAVLQVGDIVGTSWSAMGGMEFQGGGDYDVGGYRLHAQSIWFGDKAGDLIGGAGSELETNIMWLAQGGGSINYSGTLKIRTSFENNGELAGMDLTGATLEFTPDAASYFNWKPNGQYNIDTSSTDMGAILAGFAGTNAALGDVIINAGDGTVFLEDFIGVSDNALYAASLSGAGTLDLRGNNVYLLGVNSGVTIVDTVGGGSVTENVPEPATLTLLGLGGLALLRRRRR